MVRIAFIAIVRYCENYQGLSTNTKKSIFLHHAKLLTYDVGKKMYSIYKTTDFSTGCDDLVNLDAS